MLEKLGALNIWILCAIFLFAGCASAPADKPEADKLQGGAAAEDPKAHTDPAPQAEELTLRDSELIPVGDSPILGDAQAPITVVAFSDFQCPFCRRSVETLYQLQAAYPDEVRVVFKHYPLPMHQQAPAAARAAIAAGEQGQFWQMHDWLFEAQDQFREQGTEMKAWVSAQADKMGLDQAQFEQDFDVPDTLSAVERDLKLGNRLQVRGTPHFFVNGERISGARPLEQFEALVDKQLSAIEAMKAEGAPPAEIYARMVNANYEGGPSSPTRPPSTPRVNYIPVEPDDPSAGEPDQALVTIVEFSDFQCPFCKRAAPTIAQIRREYGDQVRVVFKQLPLAMHAQADQAARASLAAHQQDKFWQMHELLFEKQGEFRARADDFDQFILELAASLSLEMDQFKQDYQSDALRAQTERDLQLAKDINARGTPNFWINGINISGAQPFAKFKSIIDAQISLAEETREEKKLTGDALYRALVELNKTSLAD